MFYRRVALVLLALVLALGVSVSPALSQESLDQTVVASDGSYSFQIPTDWIATEFGRQTIVVVSSQSVFENVLGDGNPQAGEIALIAIGPDAIMEEFGPASDLQALAEAIQESLAVDMPLVFGEIEVFSVPDGRQAASAETTGDSELGGAFIVFDDGGQFVAMVVLTTPEDLEANEEMLGDIVLSLRVGSGGAGGVAVEAATLVWVTPDVFKNIDGAMAAAEDRIYISDGVSGILIFSPDGEQIGSITNDEFMAPGSPALTEDGNLWLADNFANMVFLVTPEGEILQSFGGEEVFSGLSPDFVALGPDGNLYLDDSRDEGEWIQVWSADGEFLREFQTADADAFVWSVDMGPDGSIYVVDLVSGIMVYDTDGNLLERNFASGQTLFNFVSGFAALPDGTFFMGVEVLEGEEGYKLVHLDAEGKLLGKFTAQDLGLDTLYFPADFVLTADGDVIVTDVSADGSQIFRIAITVPAGEGE